MIIPVINRTEHPIDVALEPEGEVITLAPSATLRIALAHDSGTLTDLEIEFRTTGVALYSNAQKDIVSNSS